MVFIVWLWIMYFVYPFLNHSRLYQHALNVDSGEMHQNWTNNSKTKRETHESKWKKKEKQVVMLSWLNGL